MIFRYSSLYTQAVAYTTYLELGEPVVQRFIQHLIISSIFNFLFNIQLFIQYIQNFIQQHLAIQCSTLYFISNFLEPSFFLVHLVSPFFSPPVLNHNKDGPFGDIRFFFAQRAWSKKFQHFHSQKDLRGRNRRSWSSVRIEKETLNSGRIKGFLGLIDASILWTTYC